MMKGIEGLKKILSYVHELKLSKLLKPPYYWKAIYIVNGKCIEITMTVFTEIG